MTLLSNILPELTRIANECPQATLTVYEGEGGSWVIVWDEENDKCLLQINIPKGRPS